MGRLAKAKIDEIQKLLKENYTQKETAKKVGVHVRTVRKYDPLHRRTSGEHRSVGDRLAALELAIRGAWDWLSLLEEVMSESHTFGDTMEEDTHGCPRCNGQLNYDRKKGCFVCRDCGHQLFRPVFWCYRCLSQVEMRYVEETDEFVCPKCGAKRFSPDSGAKSDGTIE